jgi:hypothetical protein
MFDWLWKASSPPEPPSTDRVWRDLAARDRALVREAARAEVRFVAFFDESVRHVRGLIDEVPDAGASERRVWQTSELRQFPRGCPVIVVERHPLPSENRALLVRLQELGVEASPLFFSALDEPLMRAFGGDRVTAMLDSLGLEPDEPIQHRLVTSAMANAREKIAKRVGSGPPTRARSMEEWLLLNGVGKR